MSNAAAREQHRDELIQIYYEEFRATLVRLGYQGHTPTFKDLLNELKRETFLDLLQNTGLVPFQYIDVHSQEFNEIEGALTERVKLGVRSPQYRAYISRHIDRLLRAVEDH